ncbi:hypothetical protein [Coxiella-like endosymbiont of Rhipicephalus sanguineus]|uniref:hypothetical protein n=1 Tax=Coxiella-like endosymbiont of Rhipicephalus sanguineus TaxID=1955402 RepID=UPI00203C0550|nr:hypothetical protein [Coxiella-like endosymbiont of Rhipicephalus sanguineus]
MGIEQKAAFAKALQLIDGQVGQLINYSDIAKNVGNVGVDATTLQSMDSFIRRKCHLTW